MSQIKIETIKKRSDFVTISKKGKAFFGRFFILQHLKNDQKQVRLGLTVSKKVGNSVERNRAKRRLRAATSLVLPILGKPGSDYVLIGKRTILKTPFTEIIKDLEKGLKFL